MRAKAFLREYERAEKRVKEIQRRLEDLEDQCTNVTMALDSDRVQTSPQPDKIGRVVAMKVDLTEKLVEAEADALDTMNRIYEVLNQIEDPDYQRLLRLRYIKCLKWEDITDQMHYEVRNIFYIHGRALVEVEKLIN